MYKLALVREQLNLFDINVLSSGRNGTFVPNRKESVHRWYPYLEGFAATFVEGLLLEYGKDARQIHDPFAGTGTTPLVSASMGRNATYTEVNPFMRLVINCKTNILKHLTHEPKKILALERFFSSILQTAKQNVPTRFEAQKQFYAAFGERPFFEEENLVQIIALKNTIENITKKDIRLAEYNLARFTLAAIGVNCSKLKRAGDLRYKTTSEILKSQFRPFREFEKKYLEIIEDINSYNSDLSEVKCINETALELPVNYAANTDLIITSPPYLNGTNYFRNTKIELWLAGYIKHENELGALRDQAMAAGINDISKRGRKPKIFPEVEKIAVELDKFAYDQRIPEMIRRYFSDSFLWLTNSYKLLKSGGSCILDIGDSCFAGVHIPTDEILISIAQQIGFDLADIKFVRERKSKNGSELKQVLLILKKDIKKQNTIQNVVKLNQNNFISQARDFEATLPYQQPPYNSRNWGHNWHSLCSYQGKLKPAIAHFLVKNFSEEGETILDPMSGSGSIPLEAFLQGRRALGNDLQELGFILTRAKVEKGTSENAYTVLNDLIRYIHENKDLQDITNYQDFGFNGKIPAYFHPETYREILAARNYLKTNLCTSWEQAIVYACLLHILHGNRPYALSRNSHPVTPFAPTGLAEHRSLHTRLKTKLERTLSLPTINEHISGAATQLSFDDLVYESEIDVVITSPPFAGSTRFFIANWMRLWMAGWEPKDFISKRNDFLEYRQNKDFDVYYHFFECCARWLRPNGRLIMHTGKTKSLNMAKELIARSEKHFNLCHHFDESVIGREKFGIQAQGATLSHQFLFFKKV